MAETTNETPITLQKLVDSNYLVEESFSTMTEHEQDHEHYGVLLYYKYTDVPNLNDLHELYQTNCESLGLLGRVRLAPHGVNVTLGGKLSSLLKHVNAVKLNSAFEGTDFKLATCDKPLDDRVAKECGFTSLSIRVVKELVTFSPHPAIKSPEISLAGRHLNAGDFHSVIQCAEVEHSNSKEKLVILDARNLYETRIGKFHTPNVETLDPGIRQYSDLPSWIDDNTEKLQGKSILMYCTGGIRCEMASAYIKSKGAGFENVYQLYGGIQRYLEQFPDGGFFRGKNFVFDHRISVGTSDKNIMGTCLLCYSSFDDYSSRCRCIFCRMLVLVCDICQKQYSTYVCELCQKHGKSTGSVLSSEDDTSQAPLVTELDAVSMSDASTHTPEHRTGQGSGLPRKLRILCLHGFRQNASGFKGRTASLAKKLKKIAELVFIDGPHELPFIYQPSLTNSQQKPSAPLGNCSRRFAWLVAPDFDERSEFAWTAADSPFDPLQYQEQTEGFDVSLAYLNSIFAQSGPFDGILGFSQGAAMIASICAQGRLHDEMNFRFVILCSGFALKSARLRQDPISCPSLHIFGRDCGKDRQISSQASRELAALFEEGCSVVVEHNSGHIIPTSPPFIDQIKDFLGSFL